MMERRKFITGLIPLVAAPAIVRAGSLMPVKSMPPNFDSATIINQIYWLEKYVPFKFHYDPIRLFWYGPDGLKVMSLQESDLYLRSLDD